MYTLEEKRFDGETFSYDTTMDHLTELTHHFIRSISKPKSDQVTLECFVKEIEAQGIQVKSGSNDAKDCKAIKNYVCQCRHMIGELRTGIGALEADENIAFSRI